MIKAIVGDITKLDNVEYICNAANGVGPMGAGVAGAIRRAGGDNIQREAFQVCKDLNPQVGEIYVTTAGKLPYKGIIHLVTMKTPGGYTDYEIVDKCLKSLVLYCRENNIKTVALPALGTGIGMLDFNKVADLFKVNLASIPDIGFIVTDINKHFINCFN